MLLGMPELVRCCYYYSGKVKVNNESPASTSEDQGEMDLNTTGNVRIAGALKKNIPPATIIS